MAFKAALVFKVELQEVQSSLGVFKGRLEKEYPLSPACSIEAGTSYPCSKAPPIDDFARVGIQWSNTSTHDTLNNVRIHGLDGGMNGPTGDGTVMTNLEIK